MLQEPAPASAGSTGIRDVHLYLNHAMGLAERLSGSLRSRPLKDLREANGCTCEEAYLVFGGFVPQQNERSRKETTQPGSACARWPNGLRPRIVFCQEYSRTVANDNTPSHWVRESSPPQSDVFPLQRRTADGTAFLLLFDTVLALSCPRAGFWV